MRFSLILQQQFPSKYYHTEAQRKLNNSHCSCFSTLRMFESESLSSLWSDEEDFMGDALGGTSALRSTGVPSVLCTLKSERWTKREWEMINLAACVWHVLEAILILHLGCSTYFWSGTDMGLAYVGAQNGPRMVGLVALLLSNCPPSR